MKERILRTSVLTVYLTPKEKAIIEAKADENLMLPSAWARTVLLKEGNKK